MSSRLRPKALLVLLALCAAAVPLRAAKIKAAAPLIPPAAPAMLPPAALELAGRAAALAPKEAGRMLAVAPLTPLELAAVSQIAARSWAQRGAWREPEFSAGRASPGTASAFAQLVDALTVWDKKPAALDQAAALWAGSLPRPAAAKPLPRGKRQRVAAHVFDIDDNLFMKLPTRIVVFRKGGEGKDGEDELAFSTEDWAKVRNHVGTAKVVEVEGRSVDLSLYEIRPESFRGFRDPPGVNNFIGAVKWIVENLPEREWQGPSWKAFVRLLSDADTARHVAVLTARGHRPESFMEAFEYLRERGHIDHLPPAGAMFAVGDPVNHDRSGAKVEAMKPYLDRVQATPVGQKAKKILDQDGRAYKRLHTAAFSDDDRTNFERMAKDLSAELRLSAARWSKVKIILSYTGPGRRYAVVLTARGGRRVLRVTERSEL